MRHGVAFLFEVPSSGHGPMRCRKVIPWPILEPELIVALASEPAVGGGGGGCSSEIGMPLHFSETGGLSSCPGDQIPQERNADKYVFTSRSLFQN